MKRRELIKGAAMVASLRGSRLAAAEAAADEATAGSTPTADRWHGLKAGVASYTLRKMPLDAAIKAIQRVGLRYVSIKDFHLPLDSTTEQRKAVAARFKEAGITPLSCGNVSMKNDTADVRRAFEYARDVGLPTIVCSPDPDSMKILDAMVREFDIRLAIHNHGPEDKRFPSPYDVWKAVQPYDKRIGLCIDVGHTARTAVDVVKSIAEAGDRLLDIHMKDLKSFKEKGSQCEVGDGAMPVVEIFKQLKKMNYRGCVNLEYESHSDNPLPGMQKSFAYMRGVLAGLRG